MQKFARSGDGSARGRDLPAAQARHEVGVRARLVGAAGIKQLEAPARGAGEKRLHDALVLLGEDRAGRVDDEPARRHG